MGGGTISSISPEEYGIVINPIAAGVGVTGGRIRFAERFLLGVDGDSLNAVGASETVFLFLLTLAIFGVGVSDASALMAGVVLKRADRLDCMLIDFRCKFKVDAGRQVLIR